MLLSASGISFSRSSQSSFALKVFLFIIETGSLVSRSSRSFWHCPSPSGANTHLTSPIQSCPPRPRAIGGASLRHSSSPGPSCALFCAFKGPPCRLLIPVKVGYYGPSPNCMMRMKHFIGTDKPVCSEICCETETVRTILSALYIENLNGLFWVECVSPCLEYVPE